MRTRRVVLAALIAVAGLALLGGAGGTQARWWDEQPVGGQAQLQAGAVDLQPSSTGIELHSRQPAGSRTYTSGTTCTVPSGWVECRVVTGTLAAERLVSGDRVRVRAAFELTASGDNLAGEVRVDATGVLEPPASAFQSAAVVSMSGQGPGGCSTAGAVLTCPVDLADGPGPGTYSAQVDITTPPANGTTSWGSAHVDQPLTLGGLRATFRQGDR